MKRPLFRAPSLGRIHATGYWVTLLVLMFGGVMVFLHYIFLVTLAVPVVGAFQRKPKAAWRSFSVATLVVAATYLLRQFLRFGGKGLPFSHASDPFGFAFPEINFVSFLVVAMIFLPLSFACAMDRIRLVRKQAEQGGDPRA